MSERIGVVLSDVDGTQIIHGQRLPSPEVQAAAHALRNNNIPLLEVTSRSHALMHRLVAPLDLQDNLCTLDGGATVAHAASGEVVWSQWLSPERTKKIVTSIGELCVRIHYDMESRGRDAHEIMTTINHSTLNSNPSVFAIFDTEHGEEIVRTLARLADIRHTPIMNYENDPVLRCIQIVDDGVDKQYGIEQMLRHGNYADQRLLVIGDGTNDISLFAAAGPSGVKVAMGNAPDELKDLADWIAPSVDDHGFAVAMEYYQLIKS